MCNRKAKKSRENDIFLYFSSIIYYITHEIFFLLSFSLLTNGWKKCKISNTGMCYTHPMGPQWFRQGFWDMISVARRIIASKCPNLNNKRQQHCCNGSVSCWRGQKCRPYRLGGLRPKPCVKLVVTVNRELLLYRSCIKKLPWRKPVNRRPDVGNLID